MPSFPGEAGLGRGCRKPGSWTPTAFTAGCLHGANPTRPVPGQGLSKSIWPSQASHRCPKPRKAPAPSLLTRGKEASPVLLWDGPGSRGLAALLVLFGLGGAPAS